MALRRVFPSAPLHRCLTAAHRRCYAALPQVGMVEPALEECTLTPLAGRNAGISVLTLNRPAARNALSQALLAALQHHLAALKYGDTQAPRVLVVRSAVENVFCAGADLKERAGMSPAQVTAFLGHLRQALRDLETLPMPTIAALDGAALGGGLELALACDMRTAGDDARLGLPETKLAIIPGAGGTQRLTRLVGVARAKEIVFTGRMLEPAEAYEYGILTRVGRGIDDEDGARGAYRTALELAREILPQGPVAIRMAKLAIDRGAQMDLDNGLEFEQACYARVIPTQDRLEGLQAFKEKRKPVYHGH